MELSSQKIYPPGPSGIISLTNERGEELSPLQKLISLQEKYGDVFQYKTLASTVNLFLHPDQVKVFFQNLSITRSPLLSMALGDGLLAADNEHWRKQRRLVLPVFQRPNIPKFTELFYDVTTTYLKNWEEYARTGKSIDIANEMCRITLHIVTKSMFSVDIDKKMDDFLDAFSFSIEHLGDISNLSAFNVPMLISPATQNKFNKALEQMDSVVYSIIKERKKSNAKPDDLLTYLLETKDAETNLALTELQIRDEIITMLLAGHETSAQALTWVWYLLACNPKVDNCLRKEIDNKLAKREFEYEDIGTLSYSLKVIKETLRLYPPVATIGRTMLLDEEIGGYSIPKKTSVMVSPFLTHRHPDFWPNPELFDPERFTPKIVSKRYPYTYFPFGGGRHTCLGRHFAMLESQVILVTIMQRFRIYPLESHLTEPSLSITLRPKNGLRCILESRHSNR